MNSPHRHPPHPRDAVAAAPHAAPFEALGMVLLCFGWFIVVSLSSVAAWRPGAAGQAFSDGAFIGLIVFELVLAAAAIAVLQLRGYPLQALYPRPSWSGALIGIGLYLGARVAIALVMPLVPHPAGTPIAEMVAEAQVSLSTLVPLAIVNGTYEEVFLLAYLMRGLRRYGASTALGIMLLVRLLYHAYQGPLGALSVVLYGAVVGVYYQRTGRLFPAVASHVIADAAAFI
jgi:membrane protease YdiL (CAAX protease family)